MKGARAFRSAPLGLALALSLFLGSVACERPAQGGAKVSASSEIDATSPAGARWPGFEPAPEPKLTDADVEQIAVKVPRQQVPVVSADNPARGPANARVTLQVFSDFECPFCVRAAPTLADVVDQYASLVRLVWRNYPLPMHERARPAARAALAAFAQGGSEAFWKMHDRLYGPNADLSDAGLKRTALELHLEAQSFEQAFHSPRLDQRIDADMAVGDAAGIQGTPAVFINDYYLMGARSHAEYQVVVERALREAR